MFKNLISLGFSVTALAIAPSAQAQILKRDILEPIGGLTRDVERGLERRLERDLLRDMDLTTLLDTTGRLDLPAAEVLDILPDVLPILDVTGALVLTEVAVENDWRAVEREWLLTVDDEAAGQLIAMDVDILERTALKAAGLQILRVRVPRDRDSYQAVAALLPEGAGFDRNHLYEVQDGDQESDDFVNVRNPVTTGPVRIGMVDTAIADTHEAFKGRKIITRDFVDAGMVRPEAHGTAIAGLFVGHGQGLEGFAPNAELFAASAFYRRNDYDEGATTISLAKSIDWLIGENVDVINMSLAGPPNAILEKVLKTAQEKGIMVVAAAGNAGPASPPLYPAAYDGVIAVTAVDGDNQVYRWANQGEHLDFAALGVSVPTVRSTGGFGMETGTSIATAYITAALAREKVEFGRDASHAVEALSQVAVDLGETGRDPVFGYGLLADQKDSFTPTEAVFSE